MTWLLLLVLLTNPGDSPLVGMWDGELEMSEYELRQAGLIPDHLNVTFRRTWRQTYRADGRYRFDGNVLLTYGKPSSEMSFAIEETGAWTETGNVVTETADDYRLDNETAVEALLSRHSELEELLVVALGHSKSYSIHGTPNDDTVELSFPELRRVIALTPFPPRHPLEVEGDVRPPVKLRTDQPHYTEEARKARISGVVVVRAVISTDGRVTSVEIVQSLDEGLDRAAADAIRGWIFEPATLDGHPVPVYHNLSVNFQLQ
ncbi:MAG: energy transducer TonB [Acidobacteriota bacterium]